jgi:protoporphyrinogen IX oxidase
MSRHWWPRCVAADDGLPEMTGWLGAAYLWVKAAHLVFVIFWMAGLFMLPRFLVYHQESAADSPERAAWIEREQRLIKIILNPAMIIVWVLGLFLIVNIGEAYAPWFLLKLLAVFGLSGYHGWMIGYARRLAKGEARLTNRQLRMANEVPGVAAAIIVILVIIKPF